MNFLNVIKSVPSIVKGVAGGAGNIFESLFKIVKGVIFTFDKFPANIICGILVLIFTLIHELVKVPIFGSRIIVTIIHAIPFALKMFSIYLRYAYLLVTTKILERLDPGSQRVKNIMLMLQTCHPDPRQWYTYPHNHFGNSHNSRLVVACMKPCPSGYIPSVGGLFCKRADSRIPRYCPKSMIMRSLEGLKVDGSKNFGNTDFTKSFIESCVKQVVPKTAHDIASESIEGSSESLVRSVCQQADILLAKPGDVSHACHETFCKHGNREPFCSHVDPTYEDIGDSTGISQLLQLPFLIAISAILLQMTRFVANKSMV
jgi:hypothetical protein